MLRYSALIALALSVLVYVILPSPMYVMSVMSSCFS